MNGRIYQINMKPASPDGIGLPKKPAARALVDSTGLIGDHNHHRKEELGNDLAQAVLLLPLEVITALNYQGWPLNPGELGENLTTEGIPYEHFSQGQQYQAGTVVLELTKEATPCKKLHRLFKDGPAFCKALKDQRGWYARVVQIGVIKQGDELKHLA